MKYLLLVGYGRPGRFDGFVRYAVDEAGWAMIQKFRDEYDEDEFDELSVREDNPIAMLAALLCAAESDLVDPLNLDCDALDPLCRRWCLLDDNGYYADCRAILINNTSN